MNKLTLKREPINILASADQYGISIFIGWTVGIPLDKAIEYAKAYSNDPNTGFYRINDKVVLSHRDAKLTLTEQEAEAIIKLIKLAYGVL